METIVNDRLDLLTRVPQKMGQAAARVANDLAYGILTDNAALNEDNTALFHSDHNNTHADALGYDGLDTLKVAMETQEMTTSDGEDKRLRITPSILIVPPELETDALQLMDSQVTGSDNQTNVFRGRYEVVKEAILTAAATYYLAGDPSMFDTVMVAFRDGNPQPFVDQKEGWKGDWIEYKIRQEAAAAAMDFRALQRGGDGS